MGFLSQPSPKSFPMSLHFPSAEEERPWEQDWISWTSSGTSPRRVRGKYRLSFGFTGNKNVQLVLQHCCTTSWKAMLCVLLTAFKPDNNLICCKTGLMWLVKRATSLFNSFRSRIVVLIYPVHYAIDRFESVVPTGFYSPALALMFRSPNHPSNIPQCCI